MAKQSIIDQKQHAKLVFDYAVGIKPVISNELREIIEKRFDSWFEFIIYLPSDSEWHFMKTANRGITYLKHIKEMPEPSNQMVMTMDYFFQYPAEKGLRNFGKDLLNLPMNHLRDFIIHYFSRFADYLLALTHDLSACIANPDVFQIPFENLEKFAKDLEILQEIVKRVGRLALKNNVITKELLDKHSQLKSIKTILEL